MTVPTAATTPPRNTCRRFFEESYVDAMQGRRSLRDVMGQIDGLGPIRSRRSNETSRRPRRRSEVFLVMNEESNVAETPERAHTPCTESFLFEDGVTHGKMTSANREILAQMGAELDGARNHAWPTSHLGSSFSTVPAISYLDHAIVLLEEGI
jgi:hypothetical protein